MCLAARGQKKFSSNGFCYVREGNSRMPSQRAGVAREPPHRRWCGGGKLPHTLPAGGGRQRTASPAGGVPGGTGFGSGGEGGKFPHALLAIRGRQGTAPPQVVWGKKNFRMPSQLLGVAREPPHRRRQASAPHFPQVVDRGRAGILQWRKQRRTKGEWSHEAGTDRTRTLRLQQ